MLDPTLAIADLNVIAAVNGVISDACKSFLPAGTDTEATNVRVDIVGEGASTSQSAPPVITGGNRATPFSGAGALSLHNRRSGESPLRV